MDLQEYQIRSFLSRVDRNFHDYGDIDPNVLFDAADAVRSLFVRFAEDKLDDLDLDQEIEDCKDNIARNKNDPKELKDFEDELQELIDIKTVAADFIEKVENESIKPKDKKILDKLFFNKDSQLYIDIDDIADRFYLVNVADEFDWVVDWTWIYLEEEYGIKSNADFARVVLENKPIDLDIYNYFDEDSVRRLVKTSNGKKFLDHYFTKAR